MSDPKKTSNEFWKLSNNYDKSTKKEDKKLVSKNIPTFGGSFAQAYRLAVKANQENENITQFKWNGGYYGIRNAEGNYSPVVVGVNKKAKTEINHGTETSPTYAMYLDKDTLNKNMEGKSIAEQVALRDKLGLQVNVNPEIGKAIVENYQANTGKSWEDMEYAAGNLPEVVVTASRAKINANDNGFVPVKDFGATVLVLNVDDKSYRVVDKGTNRPTAFAPAGAEVIDENGLLNRKALSRYHAGNYGDEIGGDLTLLQTSAAATEGLILRNQVNQLTKQEQERKDKQDLADIYHGTSLLPRTLNQVYQAPVHAVMGGLKMLVDPKYTRKDYKSGFLDDTSKTVTGAGDLFNVSNEFGRYAANMINPYTLMSLAPKTKATTSTIYKEAPSGTPRTVKVGGAYSSTVLPTETGLVRYGQVVKYNGGVPATTGTTDIAVANRGAVGPYYGNNIRISGKPSAYNWGHGEIVDLEPYTQVNYSKYFDPQVYPMLKNKQRVTYKYGLQPGRPSLIDAVGRFNAYLDDLLTNGLMHANSNYGGPVYGDKAYSNYTVGSGTTDETPYTGRAMSPGTSNGGNRLAGGTQNKH